MLSAPLPGSVAFAQNKLWVNRMQWIWPGEKVSFLYITADPQCESIKQQAVVPTEVGGPALRTAISATESAWRTLRIICDPQSWHTGSTPTGPLPTSSLLSFLFCIGTSSVFLACHSPTKSVLLAIGSDSLDSNPGSVMQPFLAWGCSSEKKWGSW
jgi:hypothetical protein